MLEIRLCKPAIHKLNILGGGGGGEFEYYKSMGGTTKRGENKFLKVSGGEQKGGGHDFWLKFRAEKFLEETDSSPLSTAFH